LIVLPETVDRASLGDYRLAFYFFTLVLRWLLLFSFPALLAILDRAFAGQSYAFDLCRTSLYLHFFAT
jgi:hypothetical protein